MLTEKIVVDAMQVKKKMCNSVLQFTKKNCYSECVGILLSV